MRLVVQRVTSSSVVVNGEVVSEIGHGFMVLVGVGNDDNEKDADYLAEKLFGLRIFDDHDGKTNWSISQVQEETHNMGMILVSQFTLMGDVRHGKRPEFTSAAEPVYANKIYEYFVSEIRKKSEPMGIKIGTGIFRTDMTVNIVNDGPFTILLDSKKVF